MKHENNGACSWCQTIFGRYPNFHPGLKAWFVEFQRNHSEAHIFCAGRGRIEQEACFLKRASKAHFGKSAHNYNAAIDIFHNDGKDIWLPAWYTTVLAPHVPEELEWYGEKGEKFPEMPHVEVRDWPTLNLVLVE